MSTTENTTPDLFPQTTNSLSPYKAYLSREKVFCFETDPKMRVGDDKFFAHRYALHAAMKDPQLWAASDDKDEAIRQLCIKQHLLTEEEFYYAAQKKNT
jgi:hypothetical protein